MRPTLPIVATLVLMQAAATLQTAHAQIPVPPTRQPRITSTNPFNEPFDEVLTRIGDNAAQFRALVPSLTADEQIEAWADPPIPPYKHRVHLTAIFHVAPQPSSTAPKESRQITEFNGRPYVLLEDLPRIPMLYEGGFSGAQTLYFNPETRHCFKYTVAPGLTKDRSIQIYFAAQNTSESDPTCVAIAPGLKGAARINPFLLQIVHIDRTIPIPTAVKRKSATFAAIDYAPTQLGDETVWLPSQVVATTPDGIKHFVALYTNYRRTASIKPTPKPPPVGTPPPHQSQ